MIYVISFCIFSWYSTAEQSHSRYVLSNLIIHFSWGSTNFFSVFQFNQYLYIFSSVYKQKLKIILFLNQKNLLPRIGDLRGEKKTQPSQTNSLA